MAFKYSKGNRGFGDITFEDDSDTGIDFEENTVKLETDGQERLVVTNDQVQINTIVTLAEGNAPAHTTNFGKLYIKSTDHSLYFKNQTGTETNLLTAGEGSDNLGNHTATQDIIMANHNIKSTGGSLNFKSEPPSSTPLYNFYNKAGTGANIAIHGGSSQGAKRIVLKTDQNLSNSYDIKFPSDNPTVGKVLTVASTSGVDPSATMAWQDPSVRIVSTPNSSQNLALGGLDASVYAVDTNSNACTMTLPSPSVSHEGKQVTFIKNSANNNLTITAGTNNIWNGGTAQTLYIISDHGKSVTLICINYAWVVIAQQT